MRDYVIPALIMVLMWVTGYISGCSNSTTTEPVTTIITDTIIPSTEMLPLINRCEVLDDGHVTYLKLTGEQSEFYRYGDVVWIDTLTHTISENPNGTLVVQIVK